MKELVLHESPSSQKTAVDNCSRVLVSAFRQYPIRIRSFPQKNIGDFYLFELPCESSSSNAPLIILTHIDTVWSVGKLKEMPFHLEGDRIYGPGVLDMKAGLTMAFCALQAICENNLQPKRTIRLIVNSAEEIGNTDAHTFIREQSKQGGMVLCLEPAIPGGALKVKRKGRLVVKLWTTGRAAHAGSPEKGINAIQELLVQLMRVKKLETGGITVTPGLIGGGEKPNVIPEKAWAVLDIRFWGSEDDKNIRIFLKKLTPHNRKADISFCLESSTPPMEFTPSSRRLFKKIQHIASDLGLSLEPGETGGGSDASIASSLNIPTIDGLGPDGNGIHAQNEHVILTSLIERTALLFKLLLNL